jgi:hypothetical protein
MVGNNKLIITYYRTVAIDYKGIYNTNNRLTFHVWIEAKLGIAYCLILLGKYYNNMAPNCQA